MPQVNSSVTHNYNRVLTPFSRFGTRRLEIYGITIFGVNDQDAIYTNQTFPSWEEAIVGAEALGVTISIEDTYHASAQYPSNSLYSGIIAGVGEVAEIYYNGYFNVLHNGTDDNDVSLIVMVAGETFIDGENPDFDGLRNRSMMCSIFRRIEQFNFNDMAVDRLELFGGRFDPAFDPRDFSVVGGGYAMPHQQAPRAVEPVKVSKASLAPKK